MTTIPRDCSETLALLVSRGLLAAERDDNAHGRPNVYRPTPQLRQAFGAQTLEELRERMGITKPPGSADLWLAENVSAVVGCGWGIPSPPTGLHADCRHSEDQR